MTRPNHWTWPLLMLGLWCGLALGADAEPSPNTTIAKAVHKYAADMEALKASKPNPLQLRDKWYEATKQFDAVLRQNKVEITYILKEVVADAKTNTASLRVGSATIKSYDPTVKDVVFAYANPLSIKSSPAEAYKLTAGTPVVVRGWMAINFDLDKPLAEQPTIILTNMPGYRAIGLCPEVPHVVGVYKPELMLKNNAFSIEIDGVPRRLP
jgi:hypothetical protein